MIDLYLHKHNKTNNMQKFIIKLRRVSAYMSGHLLEAQAVLLTRHISAYGWFATNRVKVSTINKIITTEKTLL
jgi:hypothetical protein